ERRTCFELPKEKVVVRADSDRLIEFADAIEHRAPVKNGLMGQRVVVEEVATRLIPARTNEATRPTRRAVHRYGAVRDGRAVVHKQLCSSALKNVSFGKFIIGTEKENPL